VRGVTAVLILVLAACSTAGGDTTTTALPAEPSTTTTTTPSTTITEPTTTTTVEECTERDGVLRTRRGFVCPPTLGQFVSVENTDFHLPGVYETRAFDPRLRFTRTTRFTSIGEHAEHLVLDLSDDGGIYVMSGSFGDGIASLPERIPNLAPEDWNWVGGPVSTTISIDEVPATRTDFTARCDFPQTQDRGCVFLDDDVSLAGLPPWGHGHGDKITYIRVHHPRQEFTIVVETGPEAVNTYWTEVAQPILDSIEFLDP
jgi:hypothetical protein